MAEIEGSVTVGGFIAPSDTTDTFATHDSAYGLGGHKEAANITERDAITADRRREGMFVYVLDSDGAGTGALYTLSGGITNTDWVQVTLGVTGSSNTITVTAKNKTAGTLYKGTPVHAITPVSSGQLVEVIAADASDPTAMPATLVLNEDLAAEAEGEAIIVGVITNVDTSAFSAGDIIYVAAGGGFTNTKPTGTNLIQNLGVVIKSHATSGSGIVYGSGRSNDVPNIPTGNIWAGNASGVATATDTAYIDIANGRVGIGTTSPTEKLDIGGNVKMYRGTMAGDEGRIKLGVAGELWGAYDGNSAALQKSGSNYQFLFDTQNGHFQVIDTADSINKKIDLQPSDSTSSTNARVRVYGSGRLAYIQHSAIDNNYGNVLTWSNGNSASATKGRVDVAGDIRVYDYSAGTGAGTERIHLGDDGRAKILDSFSNTLIGNSWPALTSGFLNVGIGPLSLAGISTGNYNTAIGGLAASSVTIGSGTTAVGYESATVSGGYNTAVGMYAGRYTTGTYNTVVGHESGKGVSGISTFSNTVAVGNRALSALRTGAGNTALGTDTMRTSMQTGSHNTAVGYKSQEFKSNTSYNVSIGSHTLSDNTLGQNNVAIGYEAGRYAQTDNNVYIGYQAGKGTSGGAAQTASENVVIGPFAGTALTSGDANVSIGYGSGMSMTTGRENVTVGYRAGDSLTTGSNNVLVGFEAGDTLTTQSNKLYIQSGSGTTPLIYGDFSTGVVGIGTASPDTKLNVNGDVKIDDGTLDIQSSGSTVFKVFGTGTTQATARLTVNGNGSIGGALRLSDADSSASITIQSPTTLAGNLSFTLPGTDGSAGEALVTDGSGNLSFAAADEYAGPWVSYGGRYQIDAADGNQMMIAGGAFGPWYYLWSQAAGVTTTTGTVDTTTQTMSGFYQQYGSFKMPSSQKVSAKFNVRNANITSASKNARFQIWSFTLVASSTVTMTLRADYSLTTPSGTLPEEHSVKTTSQIPGGDYIICFLAMNDTMGGTGYVYSNIQLELSKT